MIRSAKGLLSYRKIWPRELTMDEIALGRQSVDKLWESLPLSEDGRVDGEGVERACLRYSLP
jgi:hypothetical protein